MRHGCAYTALSDPGAIDLAVVGGKMLDGLCKAWFRVKKRSRTKTGETRSVGVFAGELGQYPADNTDLGLQQMCNPVSFST